ncbi:MULTISPECIES: DotI/IcmL/TraM family protein [unclassified Legionella]|uniref:DotI/IcmL/TraM family protein n=1 Tax=unclassified Legionella TaxID=2622702 RepID=UPI001F5EA4AA|nr:MULTISPECIES: DotI/IcmL/TraM family protein [unclassified Legionella]MDI9818150.1 DotI/IcmL/TraM family protein [Legionella sp. PL877]
MKRSMLCAGLMAVLCTTASAENNNIAVNINTATRLASNQAPASPVTPNPDGPQLPSPQGSEMPTPVSGASSQPSEAQDPASVQGNTSQAVTPPPQDSALPATPDTTAPQTPAAIQQPAPPQPIDCNYRIPAETAQIEQGLVMKWAEKAATQSFDFDHNNIDTQLSALKTCYTEQGWQGFYDALQKSGNLNAIKSQHLMVSSMVSGQGQVTEAKDNQWKVTLPLQVVYQNNNEKLTQTLTVNLVIGRKVSGDLGIMQMIAIPHHIPQTTVPAPATVTQPAPQP